MNVCCLDHKCAEIAVIKIMQFHHLAEVKFVWDIVCCEREHCLVYCLFDGMEKLVCQTCHVVVSAFAALVDYPYKL